MRTIRDTIHGIMHFTEPELAVIDTPEVQRLRHVKQLGFTYFVYPTSTHSRFEHSLGSMYLAGEISEHLGLNETDRLKVRLAALLHDVGHGPFSHSSEYAIKKYDPKFGHEDFSVKRILSGKLSTAVEAAGVSPKEISEICVGKKKPLGDLVSGDIDVDRMDYLIRDAYYTGAAYGVIDAERLMQRCMLKDNRVVVAEDGLSSVEALFLARYLMYPTVYEHHTARIVDSMFAVVLNSAIDAGLFTQDEMFAMDDYSLITALRGWKSNEAEMFAAIEERRLYKVALRLTRDELADPERLIGLHGNELKKLEQEVADACGLTPSEVLISISKLYAKEAQAGILVGDEVRALHEASPLVRALLDAQWSYWDVSVFCAKENVEKVAKNARKVLS